MTAETVMRARNLAKSYIAKYMEVLPAASAMPSIPVPDPEFPAADVNKLAYAFMQMADTDLRVGYSNELSVYSRGDGTRAIGSIVNFSRKENAETDLQEATVILNQCLPKSGILCALLHSFGWLLQNASTNEPKSDDIFYEVPLTLYNMYDDADCDGDAKLLEMNQAAVFAMYVLMPDQDFLKQMLSLKTIDKLAEHYNLPAAAIKNRLMLGVSIES